MRPACHSGRKPGLQQRIRIRPCSPRGRRQLRWTVPKWTNLGRSWYLLVDPEWSTGSGDRSQRRPRPAGATATAAREHEDAALADLAKPATRSIFQIPNLPGVPRLLHAMVVAQCRLHHGGTEDTELKMSCYNDLLLPGIWWTMCAKVVLQQVITSNHLEWPAPNGRLSSHILRFLRGSVVFGERW